MEVPAQILTATVDLEARKTASEKRNERAQAQAQAQAQAPPNLTTGTIAAINKRGCQKQSVLLIAQIARYLQTKKIPHQEIFCGCRPGTADGIDKWQVYVMFGAPDITEDTREEIRDALLEIFNVKELERDDIVRKSPGDVPFTLIMDWKYATDWEHMTRLNIFDGTVYVTQVDGEVDMREMFEYANNIHWDSRLMASVKKFDDAFQGKEPPRKVLSLEEALGKIGVPKVKHATFQDS
ncbi:hypothetical protein BDW74DRAFT_184087 [Aspergillus multicolor]|uniref:uncharacterized protein n=1 Tax=Aspergillus multicolor TaxID=41759 RepID=UPI003CCE31B8